MDPVRLPNTVRQCPNFVESLIAVAGEHVFWRCVSYIDWANRHSFPAEFRGPGVHHNYEDSDSGYEVDGDNKGKSFGVGGYKGRIIFLGDGTEVLTDSDDTEMFDNADEDKDLESQVSKTSTTSTSESSKDASAAETTTTTDATKTTESTKSAPAAESKDEKKEAKKED